MVEQELSIRNLQNLNINRKYQFFHQIDLVIELLTMFVLFESLYVQRKLFKLSGGVKINFLKNNQWPIVFDYSNIPLLKLSLFSCRSTASLRLKLIKWVNTVIYLCLANLISTYFYHQKNLQICPGIRIASAISDMQYSRRLCQTMQTYFTNIF